MKLTYNILAPDDGMLLTQVEDVPIASRVIASMVVLSSADAADRWKEITTKEADAIRKEQEWLMEERMQMTKITNQ